MENMAFDPRMALCRSQAGAGAGGNEKDPEALKQVCRDFEAVFINTLFQQMRKTVPDSGYLDHGMGMEMFEDVMDMEVARDMARNGGFGLGRLLYEQLAG